MKEIGSHAHAHAHQTIRPAVFTMHTAQCESLPTLAGHSGDSAGRQQDAEALAVHAADVGDHAQSIGALGLQGVDKHGGYAHSPKPPTASEAPSGMSATASAAEAMTLSTLFMPFSGAGRGVRHRGGARAHRTVVTDFGSSG